MFLTLPKLCYVQQRIQRNRTQIPLERVLQTDFSTSTKIYGGCMSMELRTGQAEQKHSFLHIP